jgi:hypothetical protein
MSALGEQIDLRASADRATAPNEGFKRFVTLPRRFLLHPMSDIRHDSGLTYSITSSASAAGRQRSRAP